MDQLARALMLLGSTPKAFGVVGGATSLTCAFESKSFPSLGRLPRQTGWQPVLSRITARERHARCQPA